KSIIDNTVEAHGGTYDLDYTLGYPSIVNDTELTEMAMNSASKILGEDKIFEAPAMTASEDFAFYKEISPISFVTLGIGDGPANHNPGFNLDEDALENGVKTQVQIILDYLNEDGQ